MKGHKKLVKGTGSGELFFALKYMELIIKNNSPDPVPLNMRD